MKTVWKFKLDSLKKQTIKMPARAVILSTHVQHNEVCVWALVDPGAALEERHIRIHGTGHPIPDDGKLARFIGTCLLHDDSLVFHVWEEY